MWLRLLIPFTLLWPVVALAAEGTALNRYRATWGREMLALLFCCVAYFVVWLILYTVVNAMTGSAAAGIVASSLLSLILVPVLLFLGFKVSGVKPVEGEAGHH